jgi:hypothetical protein
LEDFGIEDVVVAPELLAVKKNSSNHVSLSEEVISVALERFDWFVSKYPKLSTNHS